MNNSSQKTILVIEDDHSLSHIIDLRLNSSGYRVLLAGDAEKGIEILNSHKPDLIWLDIYLPGMTGFDFLENIRRNPETKNIKVVIISVSCSNKKLELAKKFDISDYFVKSNYGIDELVGLVTGIVNQV